MILKISKKGELCCMKNNKEIKIVINVKKDLSLDVTVENFSTESAREYQIGDIYYTYENGKKVENWVMN